MASIVSIDRPRCKNIANFDGDDAPSRLRPFRVSKKAGNAINQDKGISQ